MSVNYSLHDILSLNKERTNQILVQTFCSKWSQMRNSLN